MPSSPSTDSDELVCVQGLSLTYESSRRLVPVLDGIDLRVARGEVLGVIGPSGCGKTTLLSILMGLVGARDGRVDIRAKTTAMVFQRPQLLPWRSAVANAAYGLECRGMPLDEARARAAAMLGELGLGAHTADLPHQLSEGMKQRVNLARALLVEPEILLMDEPFAALDAITRRGLMDELLARWKAGALTVVFATHSLDEAVYLCDRIAIMTDKPSRIHRVVPVELPRPRGADPGATAALHAEAERLYRDMVSARR